MVVPSICATVWLNCSRAAATLARVVVTASRACESSSAEMAPSAIKPPRRCKSSSAVRSACSRCSICARNSWPCANRPRTWRTARARSASAFCLGDFRIRRIELEQRLAGLDELRVVHIRATAPCPALRWSPAPHRRSRSRHRCFRNSGRRKTSSRRSQDRPSSTTAPKPNSPKAARAAARRCGMRQRVAGVVGIVGVHGDYPCQNLIGIRCVAR